MTPTIIDVFITIDEHAILNKKGVIKKVFYFLAEYENRKIIFQKDELLSAPLVSYDEAMNMLTYYSSKRILTEAINFLRKHTKKEKRHETGKMDVVPERF